MNPHQAAAALADARCLSPDEQQAAKTLFDFARNQMYRRKSLTKTLKEQRAGIKRRDDRIRELEMAMKMIHSLAFDDAHGLDDDEALDRIRAITYKAQEDKT